MIQLDVFIIWLLKSRCILFNYWNIKWNLFWEEHNHNPFNLYYIPLSCDSFCTLILVPTVSQSRKRCILNPRSVPSDSMHNVRLTRLSLKTFLYHVYCMCSNRLNALYCMCVTKRRLHKQVKRKQIYCRDVHENRMDWNRFLSKISLNSVPSL